MKRICFLFVLFLSIPFFFVGCQKAEKKLNCYEIFAQYDEQEKTLTCQQSVEYFNNSQTALESVSFFVYANAFSEGQKPVSTAYKDRAYPDGESFGGIKFLSIEVEGESATREMKTPSILSVELEEEIFPDESVQIDLNYTISLANINHRLGVGEKAVNFGNFCPIACVYQNGEGFVENQFSANGDPFFSDISNFEVEFVCDKDFVVASTGDVLSSSVENDKQNLKIRANKVRDFAIVISKDFQKISKQVGGVEVNYFFYDDQEAEKHLQTSVDALTTFQTLIANYPYKQLSVVQTNFCFGGMEYPNLVMISDDLSDSQTVDYVIVHEIAHQWWYGMVGSNQFLEAWVDEGLTEFSCALFYERNQSYALEYEAIMENAKNTYKKFVEIYSKINGNVDESMNRALTQFATEPEYVNCTYTKGMLLFDSLRHTMSNKKFLRCLKDYFAKFCFNNATASGLIESFSASAHVNLQSFFRAWLEGNVIIN